MVACAKVVVWERGEGHALLVRPFQVYKGPPRVNAPANASFNASFVTESPSGSPLETLPGLAERFRFQVTRELARLEASERSPLRGDYLFVIDDTPRFVVVLRKDVHSGAFVKPPDDPFCAQEPFAPLEGAVHCHCQGGDCPEHHKHHESTGDVVLLSEVELSARARVFTDSATLARLLSGTMRAKAAFLAGKVRIEGDLPGFLRLIGHLKARGVRAPGPQPSSRGA